MTPSRQTVTGIRSLSPTAINRFRTCEKWFYFADVERCRFREQNTPALALANAVHHALERFFGLPLDDRSIEQLHLELRGVWPQHRRGAFRSRVEEAAYGRAALEMLSRFGEDFDLSVEPLAREKEIKGRLRGVPISGRIDRVDRRADGKLEVIDYKTGRHQIDPEDLADEPAAQFYLLLAEAAFGEEVDRVRYIYLPTGAESAWSPEREDVEALKGEVAGLVERIKATQEFVAYPGTHCNWCPAGFRCCDRRRLSISDPRPAVDPV